MDNPHAHWRIERAKEFAKRMVTFENVEALVIAGSVARGYADAYSDLEIVVFWDVLPDDANRQAIVDGLQGHFLFAYDGPAREDQLLIDGLQVDLWHITVSHQEATMDLVLKQYQSDLGSLNAMDTIRSCIPLFGEKLVRNWKIKAAQYPEQLIEKIVCEHLASFRVDYLTMFYQRKDPTGFYSQLSFLQQEAFLVLLALNQNYFPTFKWIYESLDGMHLKPEDAGDRFRKAFDVPPDTAISDTRQMLEEVLQLVEQRLPYLNTELVHRSLGYTRFAHVGRHGL
jgi:hypothetical protein